MAPPRDLRKEAKRELEIFRDGLSTHGMFTIRIGGQMDLRGVRDLEAHAVELGEDWPPDIQSELRAEVTALREEVNGLVAARFSEAGRDRLKQFVKELRGLKAEARRGNPLWTIHFFRERIRSLDEWEDERMRTEIAQEIAEARARGEELANELSHKYAREAIMSKLELGTQTTGQVRAELRQLDMAEELLRDTGESMDEQLGKVLREKRERCVWHRAKRKLQELEVARELGNTRKSERLRKEAQGLLEEEWGLVFGAEPCPKID